MSHLLNASVANIEGAKASVHNASQSPGTPDMTKAFKVKFVVRIEANNLILSDWAKKSLGPAAENSPSLGCYATRVVEAADRDEATSHVIQSVRQELMESSAISPLENLPDNPIMVKIDSVRTVPNGAKPNAPEVGFTFYPE
jgi:hypothetical protein